MTGTPERHRTKTLIGILQRRPRGELDVPSALVLQCRDGETYLLEPPAEVEALRSCLGREVVIKGRPRLETSGRHSLWVLSFQVIGPVEAAAVSGPSSRAATKDWEPLAGTRRRCPWGDEKP